MAEILTIIIDNNVIWDKNIHFIYYVEKTIDIVNPTLKTICGIQNDIFMEVIFTNISDNCDILKLVIHKSENLIDFKRNVILFISG